MLSDFRSTVGRASDVLPNGDSDFEKACLWVMTEAFKHMKRDKHYDLTWKETRFSAHLIGYMRKIKVNKDIPLHIEPESHLYQQEILDGTEDPDTAPRIDIKVMGGWAQEDVYYGIEAKILVETDWRTRRAYDLRARYVDTGIDNFINGKYSFKMPSGCIVGYIVQGSASEIATKINNLLSHRGRDNELITNRHSINGCPDCYHSEHIRITDDKKIELYHIFLTLC